MPTHKKTEEAKLPPAIGSYMTQGMVIVEIGTNKIRYSVHKALLIHHSEYFRTALRGPWKEADEGVARLVEIETPEFNLFVHWLYTQQVPDHKKDCAMWDHIVNGKHSNRMFLSRSQYQLPTLTLLRAYVLGDRLLAEEFRRLTNNHLVEGDSTVGFNPMESLPSIEWAFENIRSDRSILQYLANEFCNNWFPEGDDTDDIDALSKLPTKFVLRLLRRLGYLRQSSIEEGKTCYLEHFTEAEEKACEKTHVQYSELEDYSYSLEHQRLNYTSFS
ncbi:hypothetical protein OPT61_g6274 [Boeremia exigua]|uniref:Uncharacterized protein n=1 Tax=Boeremia exigua TaxID=749465 RepID=A0ACC2I764_9PLEO|nr:hypothetical protein OPT61_g6274 [Boeremia exigua]